MTVISAQSATQWDANCNTTRQHSYVNKPHEMSVLHWMTLSAATRYASMKPNIGYWRRWRLLSVTFIIRATGGLEDSQLYATQIAFCQKDIRSLWIYNSVEIVWYKLWIQNLLYIGNCVFLLRCPRCPTYSKHIYLKNYDWNISQPKRKLHDFEQFRIYNAQ